MLAIFISPPEIRSVNMKKMVVRLCGDLFDYCKSYGQVIERFEVLSLFTMTDDGHSEVCKFTIRNGILSIRFNVIMSRILSCFIARVANIPVLSREHFLMI